MNKKILSVPPLIPKIETKTQEMGFTMASDIQVGSILQTLVASKPNANILELGTGIGYSLCWMQAGLDQSSHITTIDNDPQLIEIAKEYFGTDQRITILCQDGSDWIKNYKGTKFDLVFADAWPGKYSDLVEILDLIKIGGFYIIDDMLPQPNWPEGHAEKVKKLILYLENRKDFSLTKMEWSTGIILMTKKL